MLAAMNIFTQQKRFD